jgi:hypothetical protein
MAGEVKYSGGWENMTGQEGQVRLGMISEFRWCHRVFVTSDK